MALSIAPGPLPILEEEQRNVVNSSTWGFRCIPFDLRHVYGFGGSFHCVTLDVRRRGGAGEYLAV